MISILIHAAAFLLAGMLVVFNVVKKEEKQFVPPKPVERPKMKLKKPKVKIKKSSKPKPTTRIVTKMKQASMPEIQLPEMSGMGEGLAGGLDGFDIMPDFGNGVTLFGGGQTIGNDLEGTFYDFKRDRNGRENMMTDHEFVAQVGKFVRSGWKTSKIARYYQSPKKLYSTCLMVPTILSSTAPGAFGEPDTGGWCWMVHYKGQLVHKEGIRFRFWGMGDDILVVRVNGKVVLNACWPDEQGPWHTESIVAGFWQTSSAQSRKYVLGHNLSVVGDWITLEPGEPQDLEIIIGEVPGGGFVAMLTVEEEGVEYELNHQGAPILPMFKTAEPSHDVEDNIYQWLVKDQAMVTNGPTFSDYRAPVAEEEAPAEAVADVAPESEVEEDSSMRVWTLKGDKTLEAEYVAVIGDKVVLENVRGRKKKISLSQISEADREYITLVNPPKFNVSFIKKSSQRIIETTPWLEETPPRILDYEFGVKIKQLDSTAYNHELKIEYFAIGEQYHDDQKKILLDRQTSLFTPSVENERTHRFSGDPVAVMSYEALAQMNGNKYKGNMVVVTDERGEVIHHSESSPWLFENLDRLRQLPIGAFMDRTGARVYPSGPKRFY